MIVKLNKSDQFGPNGPQRGALGTAHDLNVTDETYVLVSFPKFRRTQFWVNLNDLLWPDTSNTETVYSTLRGAALATSPTDAHQT